jgi:hypothetical protein
MSEQLDIEGEASKMGWVPREKFRGDPEKWVDAETFLRRGEEVMPILKANNERLMEEVSKTRAELTRTQELLKSSQEAIEELKQFNTETARRIAEKSRLDLLAELKQARENGDVEAQAAIEDQLEEVKEVIKQSKQSKPAKPPEGPSEEQRRQAAEANAWIKENAPWFGQDRRKTALLLAITDELRSAGRPNGRDLYNDALAELNKMYADRPSADRVEGSRSTSPRGGGKGYADLPAEAKEACDRQGRRLVGEGRAFKTVDDWRKHYAELYFAQE